MLTGIRAKKENQGFILRFREKAQILVAVECKEKQKHNGYQDYDPNEIVFLFISYTTDIKAICQTKHLLTKFHYHNIQNWKLCSWPEWSRKNTPTSPYSEMGVKVILYGFYMRYKLQWMYVLSHLVLQNKGQESIKEEAAAKKDQDNYNN